MPIRGLFLSALALALSLLAAPPVAAQSLPGVPAPSPAPAGETPAGAEAPAPEPPRAIAPALVPERAEQSRTMLRRAGKVAEPVSSADAVAPRLEETAARITAMQADPRLGDPVGMDLRSLQSTAQQWQALRALLSEWQVQLASRSQALAEWRRTAAREKETWRLTGREIAGDLVAEGLIDSANGLAEEWGALDARLERRQGEVLAAWGKLTSQLETVEQMLEGISRASAETRAGVLRPDHQPLWQGTGPLNRQRDLPGVRERLFSDFETAADYIRGKHSTALVVHVLFTLVGIAVLVSTRKRAQALAERRDDLARPLSVLRRPVATALALSLMAFPWAYPAAPPAFREVVAIIALLPVVLLTPLIVAPSMRQAVYVVAGLSLFVRLTDAVSSGTTMGRIVLLTYSVAAAMAAAWFFRPGGPASGVEGGRYWHSARVLARMAAVIFFISAALNIVGFVSLADLLAEGTLLSAYLALLMLLGVRVTEGVFGAMLFSGPIQRLNMARWNGALIMHWVVRLTSLLAVIFWALGTLRYFRIQEPALDFLGAVLTTSAVIGSVSISLGDVLGFVVAIAAGLYVSRLLRFVLNVEIFPRVALPRGVPGTIVMLLNYTVLGLAVVLAVAAAGIDLTKFAIIAGALSVGIGFGLQNVVNNFVSGLILAFERPVQAGDAVQVGDVWGEVKRIGVRSSTVRTWSGAEVIVPNADLISNQVTNWTLSDRHRRMEIPIGVAYGSNPHRVIEIVTECARNHPGIVDSPEPRTIFTGFGESSLDFELRAWTDEFDNFMRSKSDLLLSIHDALYAAAIEIPFPQRDLHLRSVDTNAASRLTGRPPPQPPAQPSGGTGADPGPAGGEPAAGAGPSGDDSAGDDSAGGDTPGDGRGSA